MLNTVILITSIMLSTFAQDISIESNLTKSLFNSAYDKTLRPANTVEIDLEIFFKQIVSLDDKNQIVTSSSILIASWYDTRLAWDNSSYPIDSVVVNANHLWLPDLYVINSADSNGFLTVGDFNSAEITYSGIVTVHFGLNGNFFNII